MTAQVPVSKRQRNPGERAGLTYTAVVAAARAALEQRGLPGLSMRAVAQALGVAPNALYSHVDGKSGLLDAVLDDLIGEIPLPHEATPPRDALEAIMLASFDALVQHPDLVAVSLARQGSGGPSARRLGSAMLERFAELGVAEKAAADGLRVLLVHLMGCAAFATQYDRTIGARQVHEVQAVRADYSTGLGWLLDGILS